MHTINVLSNLRIVTPLRCVFNNGFLEECEKEANVEVNLAATAYRSKGSL